jgi:hypothetical protein
MIALSRGRYPIIVLAAVATLLSGGCIAPAPAVPPASITDTPVAATSVPVAQATPAQTDIPADTPAPTASPSATSAAAVETAVPTQTPGVVTSPLAQPGLTTAMLQNGEYQLPDVGAFQLRDGNYEHQYGSGATQVNKVVVVQTALGDLDGDGVGDGAVVLALNTGGSGEFIYLVAVVDQAGKAQQAAAEMLGDRVQVEKLTIGGGNIVLGMKTFLPGDPQCCPSGSATRTYTLENGTLKLTSEA